MALTDKLTAIANAVRGKTGGNTQLTLPQIAEEISKKLSGNSVSFISTMEDNVSTSGYATLLEQNEQNTVLNRLLTDHRNDANFTITVTALNQLPDITNNYRRLWISSNKKLLEDNGTACFSLLATEKNGALTFSPSASKPTSGGSIVVYSNGRIGVYANSGGRIGAGDYLISCSWAEAESEV